MNLHWLQEPDQPLQLAADDAIHGRRKALEATLGRKAADRVLKGIVEPLSDAFICQIMDPFKPICCSGPNAPCILISLSGAR